MLLARLDLEAFLEPAHLHDTVGREGLKEGRRIKGTLVFQRAGTVEVEYRVAPIGAKSGGHMRH